MDKADRRSKRKVFPHAWDKSPKREKKSSLATDLSIHIRMMRLAGHFLPDFNPDSDSKFSLVWAIYSFTHMALMSLQFIAMAVNMVKHFDEVSALTTNAISLLFYLHGPIKVFYFAIYRRRFYKTIRSWDSSLSDQGEGAAMNKASNGIESIDHSITECMKKAQFGAQEWAFENSNVRFRKLAVRRMRKLLVSVMSGSAAAAAFWSLRPFLGLGHYSRKLVMNEGNASLPMDGGQWYLLVDATYPWETSSNVAYALTFLYQVYWIVFCLAQINLLDLLLCSWLIFACEQILHLKDILKPLMQKSQDKNLQSADAVLFKRKGALFQNELSLKRGSTLERTSTLSILQVNPTAHNGYSALSDDESFGLNKGPEDGYFHMKDMSGRNGSNQSLEMRMYQNNNQEISVHCCIKYWVEKHKHIVRFVDCIEDSYGMALLIHMLTSTITLTLLSYEATNISSVDMHALTVITYLLYTLGQVFLFCIYGNKLIEESTSVMQAAYESPWYDCTEEAKAFIQIVCQKSQRAMSISGAKFFTVSLDLFASVLGAVVTYFMVLIQLK
ncbi:Odorant receptor co-receptor [Ladona fulva]|uniref:Odorant receptor coreceptor n=1 Tax=Ladona fulva TaxID=123851 RepID=A0A8K0JYN3_LADFU|nr:Odorant receptor co-receptor [Ladona fulva]